MQRSGFRLGFSRKALGIVVAAGVTAVLAAAGLWAYVAHESYPWPLGWPLARALAGEEFEVVLHSIHKRGDSVNINVTVRRLPSTTADHFGYWGSELRLPSGETLRGKTNITGLGERLGRSAARLEFPSPGLSGPAELWMRFFIRGGQGVECLLPLKIPG